MTSWDVRSAVRAGAIAMLSFAVVWLMTAVTDEGGLAWGVRLGRSLPFSPVSAAFGTWLALSRRRTRGELLALEGLGRSPQMNALGAVLGGASTALLGALFVAVVPFVDVAGFYPDLAHVDDIRFEVTSHYGEGRFVDRVRGYRFDTDGAFEALPEGPRAAPPREADASVPARRVAAVVAMALAGLALPLLVASLRRANRTPALLVLTATVALTLLFFHAVAARKAEAFAVVLPPLALLSFAAFSYRRWGWETEATR